MTNQIGAGKDYRDGWGKKEGGTIQPRPKLSGAKEKGKVT